jgi:hypothetical protein
MTRREGSLGQLGNQDELDLPDKVCSLPRPDLGYEEPYDARASRTDL